MTTAGERASERKNPHLAVYTTYCGTNPNNTFCGKRYLHYPSYFISNNQDALGAAEQRGWIPLYLEGHDPVDDPIISSTQAKIAKVLPHRFPELAQYDFLFYADDKYKIVEALIPGVAATLRANGSPLALMNHPWLPANVLYEYTESLLQERYWEQRQMMMDYMTSQLQAGWKVASEHHYATGCILRDMRHSDMQRINETWFSHIQQCGIECQVSFFFVAQIFQNVTLLPAGLFEEMEAGAAPG